MEDVKLRCKAKWIDDGEKVTKYFVIQKFVILYQNVCQIKLLIMEQLLQIKIQF